MPKQSKTEKRIKTRKIGGRSYIKYNWMELKRGDLIYVSRGPYYKTATGEKIGMGEKGIYKVSSLLPDGILAIPPKHSCIIYIYMGKEKKNFDSGVTYVSHRVYKQVTKNGKNLDN